MQIAKPATATAAAADDDEVEDEDEDESVVSVVTAVVGLLHRCQRLRVLASHVEVAGGTASSAHIAVVGWSAGEILGENPAKEKTTTCAATCRVATVVLV